MKKTLKALLILLLVLTTFTSCFLFKTDEPEKEIEEEEQHEEAKCWPAGTEIHYLGDSDLPEGFLKKKFDNQTNAVFKEYAPREGQKAFVLGECDNDLSTTAYHAMERYFSGQEGNSIYVIYTDGSSVAIAYQSFVARWAAIEYFFNNYHTLDLQTSGVVACKEFTVSTFVAETREALRQAGFDKLVSTGTLTAGAVRELQSMYALYDSDVYYWLANLFDPDICICEGECQNTKNCGGAGFYYSGSARDTRGFLPDLESTAQALVFMVDSGMLADYNNQYKNALPQYISEAIVEFAKDLQSSEDGYFYHPQWYGLDVGNNRLNRDRSWAEKIITGFGSKPYWDTPSGLKGEYGKPGAVAAAAVLTPKLGSTSAAVAASVVVSTAKLKDNLSSVATFEKFLETNYDWENNSYQAGNDLESSVSLVSAKGQEYVNALINFLNKKQKSNGLWESTVDEDSVNGLMKISVVYTSLKKPIPRAKEALESAKAVLLGPDAKHVCSVYNPWEAINNVLTSIEKYSSKEEADALRLDLINNAEALIKASREKLSKFEKLDGGFSYYLLYPATKSQGMIVSVEKTVESDVNATNICTNSIINSIFEVFALDSKNLGFDQVERYYPVDLAYFYDMLTDLGAIVKNEIVKAKVETFDDYDASAGEEAFGVITYPAEYTQNKIGDKEYNGDVYKWFQSTRVPITQVPNTPENASQSDYVIYSKNNVFPGTSKTEAEAPSSTIFQISNAGIDSQANCYVYDADMYFVSGYLLDDGTKYEYGKVNSSGSATKDPLLQITFMSESQASASLNFSVYTENGVNYIKIGENYAGMDEKQSNLVGGIPMDQWVNIRLEYYKDYEQTEEGRGAYKPVMKIYVNGTYWAECDATITGADAEGTIGYYDRKIDRVSVSYYRYLASETYFNNVLADNCRKTYTSEINTDALVNPALPNEQKRENSDFEDGLLNNASVANKIRTMFFGAYDYVNATAGQTFNPKISYSLVADPKNAANTVLQVITKSDKNNEYADKPSRTEINLYHPDADGTDYVFSGKFYYPGKDISINGDVTHINFLDTKDGIAYALRISAVKDGSFTISLIENNSGSSGDTGTKATMTTGIACDEWFTLKIVFHRTGVDATTGADVYVNDELVYQDTSYKAAALGSNPISKVAIVHQKTNNSILYLDDLSFARSGENKDAVVSDEKVATFTDGFDTKYVHSYSFNGSNELAVNDIDSILMDNLYTKFYLIADPVEAANQVIRVVNKSGGTKAGYTRVDVSNDNPGGNCYTFEMKMYVETYSAGYALTQLNFVDANGNILLNTQTMVDSTTKKVQLKTTGNNTYPAKGTNLFGDVEINPQNGSVAGDWFTIRMEYYHAGTASTQDNAYLKVYVNDTLTYSGIAYTSLGEAIDHVEIVSAKTNKSSAVYYDDISLTRTDKAYSAN